MILGTAGLHEPGAGARRSGRPARRHLGVRRRAVRDADRAGARSTGETVSDTLAAVLTAEPDWAALPADDARRDPRAAATLPRQGPQGGGCRRSATRASCSRSTSPIRAVRGSRRRRGRGAASGRRVLPWAIAARPPAAARRALRSGRCSARRGRRGRSRLRGAAGDTSLLPGAPARAPCCRPTARQLAMYRHRHEDAANLTCVALEQLKTSRSSPAPRSPTTRSSPPTASGSASSRRGAQESLDLGRHTDHARSDQPGPGASWGENDVIVLTTSPSSGLFKIPATGGAPEPVTTLDAEKRVQPSLAADPARRPRGALHLDHRHQRRRRPARSRSSTSRPASARWCTAAVTTGAT